MNRPDIFEDTQTAFELKTIKDLDRAILLFRIIGNNIVIKLGDLFTRFALKFQLPVEGLIKKFIFTQFCGGISEKHCKHVTRELFKFNLFSILDYSVEGKQNELEFNAILEKKLELIELTGKNKELTFAVFKLSALCPSPVLEKISGGIALREKEVIEWQEAKIRVQKLCACASENKVKLYADAEESWIQTAVDDLLFEMMRKYNSKQVLIYNTVQCYRHDRMNYLEGLHKAAKENDFKIGIKLVRGAYLEKENKRALHKGLPSPICETKAATDANFNNIMKFCFTHLQEINLFIGTHNEESTYKALDLMKMHNLAPNDSRVWFAQLYGMSDHISYNLSKRGYNSIKLIPFGPVKDVIPYLLRRAQENSSIEGQAGRELSLLLKEKRRRLQNLSLNRTRL